MVQNEFSTCKAEEGGVAVATLTDDNASNGNLGKSFRSLRPLGRPLHFPV